jgi:hypothetical protein
MGEIPGSSSTPLGAKKAAIESGFTVRDAAT